VGINNAEARRIGRERRVWTTRFDIGLPFRFDRCVAGARGPDAAPAKSSMPGTGGCRPLRDMAITSLPSTIYAKTQSIRQKASGSLWLVFRRIAPTHSGLCLCAASAFGSDVFSNGTPDAPIDGSHAAVPHAGVAALAVISPRKAQNDRSSSAHISHEINATRRGKRSKEFNQ
jgi:hypothetical protein